MPDLGLFGSINSDFTMTQAIIGVRLERALASFFAKERQLLESGVREDALAHRLAIHIGTQFRQMDVDAEYNKMHVDGIPAVKKYIGSDGREHGAIPDIIIHRRQTMSENLVAIEVKKLQNMVVRKKDFEKLHAYREQLGYRHAVFLTIGLNDASPAWELTFI